MTQERQARSAHIATVVRAERLTDAIVRVVLRSDAVADFPQPLFADSYLRLTIPGSPADATARAYTVRAVDYEAGEFIIDFVVHGDEGLAGPWAARAVPGDALEFVGPGGEWSPRLDADVHLLVGDESALPAIGAGLDALLEARPDARAVVFAEVAEPGQEYPLPAGPGVEITWIHREGAPYGELLAAAVLAAPFPGGDLEAFVHGNAEMVRPLRRYLLREHGLPREHVSISGYWRAGHTDEAWRAVKRDFNAQMEAEAGA